MHYKSIMFLLLVVLIAFGIYSLVVMPKNEFPSFTVRQGVVAGVYPGANVEEVESQLTKPLETFLWSFKEIKKEKPIRAPAMVSAIFLLSSMIMLPTKMSFGVSLSFGCNNSNHRCHRVCWH